jgi:short-subunit dehydrogenase
MAYRDLNGLRILVTGASQGIGRAIAIRAAERGCRVLVSARSAALLAELAPLNIATIVADINQPADRQAMLDEATRQFGGLDVLINNAGIGATGHFMDSDPQVLRDIFETNYFSPCELTRLFIPLLKQGRTPQIVNISSVLGRRAYPARSLYCSSKFAIAGFSEAIRAELSKDGIDVLVVNPGLTQTNFSKNMLEAKAKQSLDHKRGMTSEEVAEATLNAMMRGKNEITLTGEGKLLVFATRFFPWLIDRIAKRKVRALFADEIAERKAQAAGVSPS